VTLIYCGATFQTFRIQRCRHLTPHWSRGETIRLADTARTPGGTHLALPSRADVEDPLRVRQWHQPTAPARAGVRIMSGQLGQVLLDIAIGDAQPVLVGTAEQVGGE
jgi:hypothetical protein